MLNSPSSQYLPNPLTWIYYYPYILSTYTKLKPQKLQNFDFDDTSTFLEKLSTK